MAMFAGNTRDYNTKLTARKILAWMAWLLMTVSFILLLAGVASLQHQCGSSGVNEVAAAGGTGTSGIFAPIPCDKFFRYQWWTTFWQFGLWALTAFLLATSQVHKFRSGLLALLATETVLLMENCNAFNNLAYSTNDLSSRLRTFWAGAIIGSIANFLLIIILGIHNEVLPFEERDGYRGAPYGAKTGGMNRANSAEVNAAPAAYGTNTAPGMATRV